jgi:hypothetical protein
VKSLAAALVEAQKEMPAVEKNAVNPHFGSRFVSLDHLIARTKPVLTKHGLAIVQFPATTDQGAPALTTTLIHAESGEQLSGTVPLVLAKQDMQGLGAALTYARRYGWASALAISDEDDDDGNTASAPRSGATGSTVQSGAVGGADTDGGGGGAVSGAHQPAPAPAPTFTPPAVKTAGGAMEWRYPFGKHKGKTIAEVEAEAPSYHDWFLDKSDKEDIKERIRAHRLGGELEAVGAAEVDPDFDVPFLPTIDGLGN